MNNDRSGWLWSCDGWFNMWEGFAKKNKFLLLDLSLSNCLSSFHVVKNLLSLFSCQSEIVSFVSWQFYWMFVWGNVQWKRCQCFIQEGGIWTIWSGYHLFSKMIGWGKKNSLLDDGGDGGGLCDGSLSMSDGIEGVVVCMQWFPNMAATAVSNALKSGVLTTWDTAWLISCDKTAARSYMTFQVSWFCAMDMTKPKIGDLSKMESINSVYFVLLIYDKGCPMCVMVSSASWL